ncbi:MAG: serine hydrolase domain-containing protein, partial [Pseudomonadota bacterium]
MAADMRVLPKNACVLLLVLSATAASDIRVEPGTDLKPDFSRLTRELGVPGMAYQVLIDGELVDHGALGLDREGERFSEQSVLRIASITKALTGIALAQLHESNRLDLDSPLRAWIPDFDGDPKVTVAQVAAHLSEGDVGSTYVYSSSRFALLQRVLERATGVSLAEYFCQSILRPSGAPCRSSPQLGSHAG